MADSFNNIDDEDENNNNNNQDEDDVILQSLKETSRKVESSLMVAVSEHAASKDNLRYGLDYLDAKNTLLCSYLIDLVLHLRNKLTATPTTTTATNDEENLHRLRVMKTALDKTKSLDKKLRYTIDKLLSKTNNSSSFADRRGGGSDDDAAANDEDDPLDYRPRLLVEDLKGDDNRVAKDFRQKKEDNR